MSGAPLVDPPSCVEVATARAIFTTSVGEGADPATPGDDGLAGEVTGVAVAIGAGVLVGTFVGVFAAVGTGVDVRVFVGAGVGDAV